jgi:hypothetical protein
MFWGERDEEVQFESCSELADSSDFLNHFGCRSSDANIVFYTQNYKITKYLARFVSLPRASIQKLKSSAI